MKKIIIALSMLVMFGCEPAVQLEALPTKQIANHLQRIEVEPGVVCYVYSEQYGQGGMGGISCLRTERETP